MARFTFRTLKDNQTYGIGFFDVVGTATPGPTNKLNDTYNRYGVLGFEYSDPEMGTLELSNLKDFMFTLAYDPEALKAYNYQYNFSMILTTTDGSKTLKGICTDPTVPGQIQDKGITLEWPQRAQEVTPANNTTPADNTNKPAEQPTYATGLILPPDPVVITIDTPTLDVLPPTSYESCMSDCFAKMGRETRCFVLETVKTEINNLIDNSHFDIKQLTVILNELREALDGDDEAAGLNAYFKLVNDVKFLMENYSNQQTIVNTFNNTALHHNHIQQLINNQTFINELLNNQDLIKNLINNTITKITNYLILDDSTDGDIKNSLINALNQLIIKQIAQVKNELNLTINNVRDNFNNQIQQINIQIANLNGNLNNNTNSFINKFELNNLQIQIDALKDAIKNINGLEINPNIDLSKNVTITNIFTQLSQITNNLNAINNNFKQYISRQDLANACQTACNAFLTALRDPTPCEQVNP